MIFDFWQEHLGEFPNLLSKRDFSPQEIGRYKAMIERLITQGGNGTWKSYDDASNYYNERADLAENTRHFYLSAINKLQAYTKMENCQCTGFVKAIFQNLITAKGH